MALWTEPGLLAVVIFPGSACVLFQVEQSGEDISALIIYTRAHLRGQEIEVSLHGDEEIPFSAQAGVDCSAHLIFGRIFA